MLILALALLTTGCQQQQPIFKETRMMMGTFVEVTSAHKEAAGIAFSEIQRIESLLSKYVPESEISRLNNQGSITASPETRQILQKAQEFYKFSNGAFDVTIGPLLDLWGFSDKKYRRPQDAEIAKALESVGSRHILIGDDTVELNKTGMKIDLGAIAKGYAVDMAVKRLKSRGIDSALINAGGDIFCLGNKGGSPWRIAIKHPAKTGFVKYLNLQNKAVATSGGYEQYFNSNGKALTHIIDPRRGLPVENKTVSVTVITEDCLTADAIATIAFVEGRSGIERLKKAFNAEILLWDETDV